MFGGVQIIIISRNGGNTYAIVRAIYYTSTATECVKEINMQEIA